MARRYNPPPNWPAPPADWTPPKGWQPDPAWGPAPDGWELWSEDGSGPKKSRRKWPWIAGGVVAIIVIASAAAGGSGSSNNSNNSHDTATAPVTSAPSNASSSAASKPSTSAPKKSSDNSKPFQHTEDVKITSCAADDLGYANAKVVVTNNSSKGSDYIITVAFDAQNGAVQVGTGSALVNDLQPGQSSVEQDANSLQKAPAGGFTCRVSDATRMASS
jgi:hypothetical protein